ncbi:MULTISPECIES: hypothetical protein [unclassified Colwellia]|jgi:hypothetical protein|uniref:hypothetical protein n=1 Tax=unclassified Colwellia TaxID=196834 RepID=UPI0015F428BF|nr:MULTISPECIES: hypothetical protein [unclassified Colwellia]MBA6363198.1 hypothetical protein [Colwellia sp. BRX8-8]MBA6353020.1 hypothetical protein [Colwellia sp. BRX9-1]MBA6356348.1 hypothetical protein [Colwellia sp. BRX8-3]MBA6359223.1 hypothetical protein [Colwellia sp. BRX8-6]MBA6368126.1 hypothetical protein [Colwellia sp. BRX8-5]
MIFALDCEPTCDLYAIENGASVIQVKNTIQIYAALSEQVKHASDKDIIHKRINFLSASIAPRACGLKRLCKCFSNRWIFYAIF